MIESRLMMDSNVRHTVLRVLLFVKSPCLLNIVHYFHRRVSVYSKIPYTRDLDYESNDDVDDDDDDGGDSFYSSVPTGDDSFGVVHGRGIRLQHRIIVQIDCSLLQSSARNRNPTAGSVKGGQCRRSTFAGEFVIEGRRQQHRRQ